MIFFFKAPGLLCLLVGLHYFAQNSVIINQCYNNNTNDISNVIFIMIITIAKFK